jgi:tetratricopeptide (TPR) repeat protein
MNHSLISGFMRLEKSSPTGADRKRAPAAAMAACIDLIVSRRALDQGLFEEAERHIRQAIDREPESAEAHSLMGLLHERLSEYHSAYHCYRVALRIDEHDPLALAGLHRYCNRFHLDFWNPAINPLAERYLTTLCNSARARRPGIVHRALRALERLFAYRSPGELKGAGIPRPDREPAPAGMKVRPRG